MKYEAMQENGAKSGSWFSFGSWVGVAAGLALVFTFGFFIINSSGSLDDNPTVAFESYQTEKVPQSNIVNVAFGDHEFCAIKFDPEHPVRLAKTPVKYKDVEKVALPELKNVLADYKVKKSHTCEFNKTDFTHVVLTKGENTVSLMLTEKGKAEKLGNNISTFSSSKYELARFDVENTAVFVVSGLDKKVNSAVANALYNPMLKYLKQEDNFQTSLLFIH